MIYKYNKIYRREKPDILLWRIVSGFAMIVDGGVIIFSLGLYGTRLSDRIFWKKIVPAEKIAYKKYFNLE